MQHVTVPRETWDAMREALDTIISAHPVSTSLRQTDAVIAAREALTAANAVSAEQFCYCNPDVSLQMVSGGVAPDGYLGRVTLRIGDQYRDYHSHPQATEPQDAIAWEATTPCYIKYVTDKRYRSFSDAAKRWYKPYKCSSCQAQATEPAKRCWCETCRPLTIGDMRMIVCPDCGNKRCPKATHHHNACTNSNDIGQKGSSWEHVRPVVKESLTDQEVPAGYMLVPVNATPEMIAAAEQVEDLYRRGTPDTWGSVYRAMLTAAPEAEQ